MLVVISIGSKGLNFGLSEQAYSNSPNEDRIPAPYAFFSPLCLVIPNSIVNQYMAPSLFNSISEAPKLAKPISYEKSAKSLWANIGACPNSSCTISGSGVYSGLL